MADTLSPHVAPPAETSDGWPAWKWLALLAAPFLICLAWLLVTGGTFPTFWGGDELSHWALIQWFAKVLPGFRADYPASATAPLFHLAGACLVRVFGPHLQLARACNALLSIGGGWALFGILRRSCGHGRPTAALLCAVFLSSSYYFGYAFRLLTDNMAIVGCLLAMGELFRFTAPSERTPLARYLRGCLWCGLAVLTRQNYLFLCLPFGLTLLTSPLALRQKALGLCALTLALAPFAALAATWRGLVPPNFQEHHAQGLLHLCSLALPVMLLGIYTPFFFLPMFWRKFRADTLGRGWWRGPLAGAVAALAVLVCCPLFPVSGHPELTPYFRAEAAVDWGKDFGGWMYSVADRSGRLTFCHNSFLFWLALPLGAAAAVEFLPETWRAADPRRRLTALFLLSVMISSLLNIISCQKYYDGLVLLFLLWRAGGEAARDPWQRRLLCGLILIFCAYTAAFPFLAKSETFVMSAPTLPPPAP